MAIAFSVQACRRGSAPTESDAGDDADSIASPVTVVTLSIAVSDGRTFVGDVTIDGAAQRPWISGALLAKLVKAIPDDRELGGVLDALERKALQHVKESSDRLDGAGADAGFSAPDGPGKLRP